MRRLREVGRRVLALGDKLLFPEAESASDQWQRVVMNGVVDRHLSSLGPAYLSAAEISGNGRSRLGWKSFRSLNYPDFDLCAPVPAGLCFDVVICEQVLEHVVDPWQAAANLRALCAPGGHVVVTSPFLIKVHEIEMFGLRDYWRFTPRGLHALLEGVGLQVETIDGWGNRMCVLGNLSRWAAYRRWLPLRNEPDIPLQLWAFAKNPA